MQGKEIHAGIAIHVKINDGWIAGAMNGDLERAVQSKFKMDGMKLFSSERDIWYVFEHDGCEHGTQYQRSFAGTTTYDKFVRVEDIEMSISLKF